MKPAYRFTTLVLLLGLALAACGKCDKAFVQPTNVSPPHMSMTDSLRPVLTWDYADGSCDPQQFIINLFTNSTNGTIAASPLSGVTDGEERSWAPAGDLTPGMAYLWSVASKNATTTGEYSDAWQFFVGPACGAADLLSPTPIAPGPASASTGAEPTFVWGYPGVACAPEGYRLQVSQLSDFAASVVDMREANPFMAWTPGVPLEDCTDHFWRVAGISGPDDGPWSPVAEFTVNATGPCPCGPDELAQPTAVWPAPYEIVPDLEPGLEWNFPGACEVGGYAVHLSPTFDMSDTSLFGGTGSPGTVWGPGEPLEPATQYWWQVAAGVGTDFGPYSVKRSFFTGPECTPLVGLPAPELISPANGEYLSELEAWLHFTPGDPGCIPDGYLLDLQTDPSFGGTNLLAEYDLPATNVITDPLEDCTTYYWRVAAVQGGSHGPYSATRWFRTNQSGACLFAFHPAWVLENVNCRLCGATSCKILYIFQKGALAHILGQSLDGFFYKLGYPKDAQGTREGECYAPSDSFSPVPEGIVERVRMPPTPTLVPTPTPTPVPPACHPKLDLRKCIAAGGKWDTGQNICICP
jgi:hypothetical protein